MVEHQLNRCNHAAAHGLELEIGPDVVDFNTRDHVRKSRLENQPHRHGSGNLFDDVARLVAGALELERNGYIRHAQIFHPDALQPIWPVRAQPQSAALLLKDTICGTTLWTVIDAVATSLLAPWSSLTTAVI